MSVMATRESDPPTAHDRAPRRVEISFTQLLAGSAAAVCGAWLASKIGVAGTVVGAGLVSALVTVLSAVYAHGARRARERLVVHRAAVRAAIVEARRKAAPQPSTYAADSPTPPVPSELSGASDSEQRGDVSEADAIDAADVERELDDDDELSRTNPLLLPPFELEHSGGYRWGRIALAALLIFLVGMAAVTVVELVNGHSLACTTAGIGCDDSTTVPLPGRSRPSAKPKPTVSAHPTVSSTTGPSPSTTPSTTPSTSPSTSPSVTTSGSPSGTPTASNTGSPSASPSSTLTPAGG
jgi:hypothetical protein